MDQIDRIWKLLLFFGQVRSLSVSWNSGEVVWALAGQPEQDFERWGHTCRLGWNKRKSCEKAKMM